MSALGSIWDTAGEFLVWSRATANESGGRGQVSIAEGETRDDVEMLALPGFYSVISEDDALLTLRRDDGGVALAAQTARPSGATAGDRGILTGSTNLRVRGGAVSVLNVPAGVALHVTRETDAVNAAPNMVLWYTAVSTMLGIPIPTDFGLATATTTKLESE